MRQPDAIVGADLATRVARNLEAGQVLAHSHRDYCGTGMRYADGEYIYGQVYDGLLPSTAEARHGQLDDDEDRKTFVERSEFISWLASQTDRSLSGEGLSQEWQRHNGRVTIERLWQFVDEGE
jgi:hypothetical protein